ncbi:cell division protein FtsL [Coralloluteibacterium stylophorae]|uniref:Cell division protein FtsL n=1 Tax=Coralloluteibacterium stylophorae TaxID=1776034 RepID=A0A8J7VUG1_9GAMM|nr:cell division protein FtsL [Coralloluteibacterium stylophorae]MBS7457748.1 cell division protein FtsL [Coralloluteibacterium stylophorae]
MSFRVFGFVVLLLATVASAVAVTYARHEHRQRFIELSTLENERDELDIEFGRLQLEQATWADTHRIEQIAAERLDMRFPEGADIVVIKR